MVRRVVGFHPEAIPEGREAGLWYRRRSQAVPMRTCSTAESSAPEGHAWAQGVAQTTGAAAGQDGRCALGSAVGSALLL